MKLSAPQYEAFNSLNPEFDILTFDFINPKNKGKLNWSGYEEEKTREELMLYQRLLRITYNVERVATMSESIAQPQDEAGGDSEAGQPTQSKWDYAVDLAKKLASSGLHSAHHIGSYSEQRFVKTFSDDFDNDEELLRQIHREAVGIKTRVRHLWANLKNTVGSPYYMTTGFANVSPDVTEYLTSVPSYQDLFGSLNYCACEQCRSIFSPAAYFVDLMRVTAEYITNNNPTIPTGYTLQTRRPDLWRIELTCENTNDLIPYLQIVNEILENVIGGDAFYALATATYPFNLPFNHPLIQTRTYLKEMKGSLWEVYLDFQRPDDTSTVTGLPTTFQTAREYVGLSPEQYAIVSTANTNPASLSAYYGVPQSRLLPLAATGVVNITTNTAVTGIGTHFDTQVEAGDFVQVANVSRLVTSVNGPASLTVDTAWTTTLNNQAMTIIPSDSLSMVESFLYHTRLTYGELKALLNQGLDSQEFAAGIAGQFFINSQNPAGKYLTLEIDSTDPNAPMDVIANLALNNLDTLNRFIRLSKISGIGFADLNWTFQGATTINEALIKNLFAMGQLTTQFKIGYDEVIALYSNIKTIGVVDPNHPMDLFDRLFNKPGMLAAGASVYHPLYSGNPLYTDPVIPWTVNSEATAELSTRSRLLNAFGLSDNDLTLIANQALGVLNITNGVLPLTVENLSLLYSYSKMPSLVGMTVDQFLLLLDLADKPRLSSISDVQQITSLAQWIVRSRINIYALQYALTGQSSSYFQATYNTSNLLTFLQTLWALASNWLINPTTFIYENITADESASYYKWLQDNQFLSAYGVVLDTEINFTTISCIEPLKPDSFVTNDITLQESEQSFILLIEHSVLSSQGCLSASFSASTDLSFLFPDTPLAERETKIAEVREILLVVQAEIQYILDTLYLYGTEPSTTSEPPPAGLQEENLVEQMGQYLGAAPDIMLPIARFAAAAVSMTNYVAQFLQPPPPSSSQIPEQTIKFMEIAYRALIVIKELNLTPYEITSIATHPEYFNIASLASLTLEDVEDLYTFKVLERAFRDTSNQLITFFATPLEGDCSASSKFQILANLTHWNISQICQLVSALWGTGDGYNSVLGVQTMKVCFDLAARFGVDMNSLLNLTQLAGITGINQQSWDQYNAMASSWLDILHAKYRGDEWVATYESILNRLNEQDRDALAGLAIYRLQANYPAIQTLNDLYSYLLIDVEMSGCAKSSYIRQGLSSVQLYMQRCRMNLEPGVENVGVPEVWWEWLSSYRIWEANRKVYLYPENYLYPTLRSNKTVPFNDLQDLLLSSDINDQSVNDAYLQYFEQLVSLSNIKHVASYYYPVTDPDTGVTNKTIFFIGRTTTQPYTYYYQMLLNNTTWTAWQKIDLTINSSLITPIYIFDRLFLFWSEMETTSTSTVSNNASKDYQDTATSIKYSFYNFSNQWVQPQTASRVVTNFTPYPYQSGMINPNNFNLTQLMFQTPVLFFLPSSQVTDERMLLLYGYYYAINNGAVNPLLSSYVNDDEKLLTVEMNTSSQRSFNTWNTGWRGVTTLTPGLIVDNNLNMKLTYVNLMNYTSIIGSPQPYALMTQSSMLQAYLVDNVFLQLGSMGTTIPQSQQALRFSSYAGQSIEAVTQYPLLYNISMASAYQMNVLNQPGWFVFNNGDETFLVQSQEPKLNMLSTITVEQHNLSNQQDETDLIGTPYTSQPQSFSGIKFQFNRLTSGAIPRLSQNLFTGGIPSLLSVQSQETPINPTYPFSRFYQAGNQPPPNTLPPALPDGDTIDYSGPFGIYFWEVYYYIPFMIGDFLAANQRFSDAKKWYEYIFNPTVPYSPELGNDSYWQFLQLRGITVESLQQILTDSQQIAVYNNDPFDPNAIAQLRPSALQKAIVMRYIDNLIRWGDLLFTKDTWESINDATLLYILAQDLLGPRPVQVGVCSQEPPADFADIQAKYGDNIPQFLIYLENAVPPMPTTTTTSNSYVPFNDLNSYFCVGENQELMAYWDRVEDRLYKIRHCMNIQGVERQLALFEPPINPLDLVRAAASGRDLLSVADQWQPTSSPYRFVYLLSLAKSFTIQLQQLGGSLLAALEKKDAESLLLLRQTQEIEILNLTTSIREKQIEQIEYTIDSLEFTKASAVARNKYYQDLIAKGLSPKEVLNIQAMILSNVYNISGTLMRGLSSFAYLAPNVGSPFAMTYGGSQIGSSLAAAAAVFDVFSSLYNMVASQSLTMAGYERRAQEWQFQLDISAIDIQQIDAQIEAAKVQSQIATRELDIHLKTIENSKEIEDFLRSKFTNVELYQWMITRISTIYFQTYRIAIETAIAAQIAFQYELNTNDSFITLNYWDSLKKGLLAGEQLMLNLNQLEQAYAVENTRTLEIQKTISLLQLNPKALADLKQTGRCSFEFDEALFDYDFPGHYCRKITSISMTLPALVGPYQNVKAMLTQTGNQILIDNDPEAVAFLLESSGASAPSANILRSNWRSNQKIAISRGTDDNGMFQLNFSDERYLPFEGTGAISRWVLDMPKQTNRIDFNNISDVVIRLSYTALDGGELFKEQVIDLLKQQPYVGYVAFSLVVQFPSEWYAFLNPPSGADTQSFSFLMLSRYFPYGLDINKVTELFMQITLAQGVELGGTLKMSLMIAAQTPIQIEFNNRVTADLPDLNIGGFMDQQWTFSVNKNDIPPNIKDPETGMLDSKKFLNLGMIVSYDATINW